MSQQRQQPIDFRRGTRQRDSKIKGAGTIAFPAAGGAGNDLELSKVGYVARLFINWRGVLTFSAGGTMADKGPWSLLNRLQFKLNNGAQNVMDLSGYGLFAQNHNTERGFRADRAGTGDTTPHADNYAAGVASGANTWSLWWVVPIAMDDAMSFDAGILNLQAPEIVGTLSADFATDLTKIASNISGLAGNLHCYVRYYEVPDPQKVMQPPVVLHRLLEQSSAIGATGDVVYTVPRGGRILRLTQIVTLNNARSDSLDQFRIEINTSDTLYRRERQLHRLLSRVQSGVELPVGVYQWDFAHTLAQVGNTDARDMLDTEQATTVDFITTVSSGATLGTNTNFQATVREIMQAVQAG